MQYTILRLRNNFLFYYVTGYQRISRVAFPRDAVVVLVHLTPLPVAFCRCSCMDQIFRIYTIYLFILHAPCRSPSLAVGAENSPSKMSRETGQAKTPARARGTSRRSRARTPTRGAMDGTSPSAVQHAAPLCLDFSSRASLVTPTPSHTRTRACCWPGGGGGFFGVIRGGVAGADVVVCAQRSLGFERGSRE